MSERIAVISDLQLGAHLAHAINVVKTAGGFARLGHKVLLLCRPPENSHTSVVEALGEYGESDLDVMCPDPRSVASAETFGTWAADAAHDWGATVTYCRHFWGAIAAASRAQNSVLETHSHPGDDRREVLAAFRSTRSGATGIRAVITISETLKSAYIAAGAHPSRVHVVPDGVDLDLFSPPATLPPSPFARWPGPHIVYCGHLYEYKGILTILAAALLMPDATFHLVGGTPQDLREVEKQAASHRNVVLHGRVPHRSVPQFQWHADALLLPPSRNHPSAQWTSPVKLGEYLAAGPPIIATRIPGLTAWVAEPAVHWIQPDDADAMVRGIRDCLAHTPAQTRARQRAAATLAGSFSYARRAESILLAARTGDPAEPAPHRKAGATHHSSARSSSTNLSALMPR